MGVAVWRGRGDWGAGANGRRQAISGVANTRDRGVLRSANVDSITGHYPGSAGRYAGYDDQQIIALLKSWQRQHRAQGWGDIGYNFLIDGRGQVWEGCGWAIGAHAGAVGANQRSVGIQFILGIGEEPTAAQVEAFREFRFGSVLPNYPKAFGIVPHSHWHNTGCPGDNVRRLIANGSLFKTPGGSTVTDVSNISNNALVQILTASVTTTQGGEPRQVAIGDAGPIAIYYGDLVVNKIAALDAKIDLLLDDSSHDLAEIEAVVERAIDSVREEAREGTAEAIRGITTTVEFDAADATEPVAPTPES